MFEKWRSSQIKRLLSLTDRFGTIRDRANDRASKVELHARILGPKLTDTTDYRRITLKANGCWMACIDANESLLMRRASPLLFWWQLRPLERVAAVYEETLDQADAGESAGKSAFQERFGISEETRAQH